MDVAETDAREMDLEMAEMDDASALRGEGVKLRSRSVPGSPPRKSAAKGKGPFLWMKHWRLVPRFQF